MPCTSKSLSLPMFPQQGRPFTLLLKFGPSLNAQLVGPVELFHGGGLNCFLSGTLSFSLLCSTYQTQPYIEFETSFCQISLLKTGPWPSLVPPHGCFEAILQNPRRTPWKPGHRLALVIYTLAPLLLRTRTNSSSPLHLGHLPKKLHRCSTHVTWIESFIQPLMEKRKKLTMLLF